MHKSLMLIFNFDSKSIKNSEIKRLTNSVLNYVMTSSSCDTIRDECIMLLPIIIVNSNIGIDWLRDNILNPGFNFKKYQQLVGIFVDVVSLSMSDTIVLCSKTQTELNEYLIVAPGGLVEPDCKCDGSKDETVAFLLEKIKKRRGMLTKVQLDDQDREILQEVVRKYIPVITSPDSNPELKLKVLQILPQLIKNVNFMLEEPIFAAWIKIFSSPDPTLMSLIAIHVKVVINQVKKRLELGQTDNLITTDRLSDLFLDELLKGLNHAFNSQDKEYQEDYLLFLQSYSATENITQIDVLHCFRFALRFLIKSTSKVKYQAYNAVEMICRNFNIRPHQLLNWYRMTNIRFIMDIVANNYCMGRVKMMETIKEVGLIFF